MIRKIKIKLLKIMFKKELGQIYDIKSQAIANFNAELHIGINIVLTKLGLF